MKRITQLSPEPVWRYFSEILRIPRPSKKEEQIIAWLLDFAAQHDLPVKKDDAGNVLISKSATPGKEQRQSFRFQQRSHHRAGRRRMGNIRRNNAGG
jgi:di/tripeptidase